MNRFLLVISFFINYFYSGIVYAKNITSIKYNCSVFERYDARPANVIYETSFEVTNDQPFYRRLFLDQSRHVMIDVGLEKNQGVSDQPILSLVIHSRHSLEKSATSFYPLGVFPIAMYYAGLNKGIVCNKGN